MRHDAPVRLGDHVHPSDRVAPVLVGEPLDVVAPGLVEELAEGDHLVRTQRVTADEPDQWI